MTKLIMFYVSYYDRDGVDRVIKQFFKLIFGYRKRNLVYVP